MGILHVLQYSIIVQLAMEFLFTPFQMRSISQETIVRIYLGSKFEMIRSEVFLRALRQLFP